MLTWSSVASPVFVTLIVNVAVAPKLTDCESGDFSTLMLGWITLTGAVSSSQVSGPVSGVPQAVAEFVNDVVTFSFVHVYVMLSPGWSLLLPTTSGGPIAASSADVFAQSGA